MDYIDQLFVNGVCSCGNPASAHCETVFDLQKSPIKCNLTPEDVEKLVAWAKIKSGQRSY